mgnify:FL=1
MEDNGWPEYQRLVIDRLDRLERGQVNLLDDVIAIREAVAGLRVKSSVWGFAAGALPVLIAVGIALWKAGLP